jgi:protein O-mannosyl-transferase
MAIASTATAVNRVVQSSRPRAGVADDRSTLAAGVRQHGPPVSSSSRPQLQRAAGALLLLVLTSAAYLPAMRGGYVWDDPFYVRDNYTLRSLHGLHQIWLVPTASPQYYPMVFTSFWLEYRLWGDNPHGYHVTNVVLHGINAVLVWTLLSRLNVPGAFIAAGIFALHPVHVESVAWISERKNVLSGFFALLAGLTWLRFVETGRARSCLLTGLFFSAALLSKTQVAMLPLLLLLLAWWKHPATWRRHAWPLLPLLSLGGALALVTMWREHLGPKPELPLPELSIVERSLIAGHALWFYAEKLLCPVSLMTIYPQWHIDPTALWQYAFPLGAIAFFVLLWALQRRCGPGPLVAACAFAINLGPALGFVDFDFMRVSFVADHLQYIASIGLIGLAAAATNRVARVSFAGHAWARWLIVAPVMLALGTLTWRQSDLYRDEEILGRDNLAKNPESAVVHNHLGTTLLERKHAGEAIQHFAAAVRLNPEYAQAQFNWGNALITQNELDAAIAHFAEALRISPDYPPAHLHWGNAAIIRGNLHEAVEHFAAAARQAPDYAPAQSNWCAALISEGDAAAAFDPCAAAVRSQPDYPEAHNNLGMAFVQLGRLDDALEQFAAAARLKPDYAEAYDNWGRVLQHQGKLDEAITEYTTALRLNPRTASTHDRLGTALLGSKRTDEAIEQFAAAADIDPQDAAVQDHLGVALSMLGSLDDATDHFAAAARLRPDAAEIQNHWGVALSLRGQLGEAVEHFEEAVRLQPTNDEAHNNLEKALRDRDAAGRGAS